VNVTAAQFKPGGLVPAVERALLAIGLEPRRLCIEITEQTRTTMAALKGLAVLVAIDDFGTGYSSFGLQQPAAAG
jgi:EAL domain-containing protein (putative c-di-GMP-specific phosphodiesterase class I)